MKFLLFIALVAVCVGLFFDDKQNKADLAAERATNADLTTSNANLTAQLNSYQAAVYQLKEQLSNAQTSVNRGQVLQQPQYQSPLQMGHLQLAH